MDLIQDNQTIIAECTPKGTAALSLIRLSGSNAIPLADRMLVTHSRKKLTDLASHTIHHAWIITEDGHHVDEVLVLLMRGPKTFTGEDTIEISCHGNPFIVHAIMQIALSYGAQLAGPGEFTRRAVLNNKLDLIRAEAIHEVISAQSNQALKYSLAQLKGSLSERITHFEHVVLHALALSEASFEFIDEDMQFGTQILDLLTTVRSEIATLKKSMTGKTLIKQGVRIALIGSVNTGKSSLFNSLLNTQRSIVTAYAGTTRDTVEATLEQDGIFITLIDTAGLRTTHDTIEQEGIERSFQETQKADCILLVYDGSRPLTEHEAPLYQKILATYQSKIIPVYNKSDCVSKRTHEGIWVSAITKNGIDLLESTIKATIERLLESATSPFLLTQRQYTLLMQFDSALSMIEKMLISPHHEYELISYHIRDALALLSELTGKTISEQSMDLIFQKFCIGK
jgi:tRNA modification GTPase